MGRLKYRMRETCQHCPPDEPAQQNGNASVYTAAKDEEIESEFTRTTCRKKPETNKKWHVRIYVPKYKFISYTKKQQQFSTQQLH